MSVTVKQLNGDASFLLTFRPILPFPSTPEQDVLHSFTIVLDPWLASAPSNIMHRKFASSRQKGLPCVSSFSDLPEPDLVIVSQNMTDHCHKETLQQLPSHLGRTRILAPKDAADTIKSWKYFDADKIIPLQRWNHKNHDRLYRIPVPSPTPSGEAGEVTIAYVEDKWNKDNMAKTHTAIGITYTPHTDSSCHIVNGIPGPITPPHTPLSPSFTTSPAPTSNSNQPLSVIFSPHGCNYSTLASYAKHHLAPLSCLPLTALLHCFDEVKNAWYLGGKICNGMQSGVEIAQNLDAQVWISAHDADKEVSGVSIKALKIKKFERQEVEAVVSPKKQGFSKGSSTRAIVLDVGEEITLSQFHPDEEERES